VKKATFALALAALAATSPAPADDARSLEDGHVEITTTDVPGSDVPKVVVRAIVRSPAASVWAVVSDCAHYKERLPHTAASRLVSVSGKTVRCEVTIAIPFPFPNLTAVTEATHEVAPDHMTRTWHLVSGDYVVNDGSWDVRSIDGGAASLVTYTVHAQPKGGVPGFLRSMAQKKALPELMERLRTEAAKSR
jgi:ribosome-associated toxin RatA of RatAB toxin-antitoxin module